MTPENFAYWLQGYFELAVKPQVDNLISVQITCIRNHINLVKVTTPNSFFINTIEALLDAHNPNSNNDNTDLIKKVLGSYFEHVIDPTHPKPVEANNAHNHNLYPSEPPRMRC